MELVRLVAPLAQRREVARRARAGPVLFRCADADTVLVAAALAKELAGPFGVWLRVGGDYPAQLAARDLKTLSTMTWLEHAAIESDQPTAHAQIVRVLLAEGPVDYANTAARLVGAFNRPAPPRPLRVWAYHGGDLVDDDVLRPRRVEVAPFGELTYFA